ncbi:MAG: putative trafficking protein particle complex subunit 2 [Streblomastix strix]|uniref:Putative trafficking protein particle complex subunit 2 n=1 Tax=Streblomastix strix TaxID=222440 RepID=A0A5J4V322_9EUKA|nr:MAG: putative trafficking protein particle complex subunit 2 [Streblomastix strix]
MYIFLIITRGDNQIFRRDFGSIIRGNDLIQRMDQFLVFASLDCVDEQVWQGTNLFLRTVDVSESGRILAYVTPGHARFLLFTDNSDSKVEQLAETFFKEIHEQYIKVILNPLYEYNSQIISPKFDAYVQKLGDKLFS